MVGSWKVLPEGGDGDRYNSGMYEALGYVYGYTGNGGMLITCRQEMFGMEIVPVLF